MVIPVNLNKPEANGPFLVYSVPDFTGAEAGTEFKGYYIVLPVDKRFVDLDDEVNWFTANVVSQGHILFRIPACRGYEKVMEEQTCIILSQHSW